MRWFFVCVVFDCVVVVGGLRACVLSCVRACCRACVRGVVLFGVMRRCA